MGGDKNIPPMPNRVKPESFSKKKGRKGSSYNTSKPSCIKEETGKYAHSNKMQAAINRFK